MDLETLNKSQIVLLTLLVSFMTSIATGIVTVALMEQAPPTITETVNRVVEHTVERVVSGQTAAAVTPETKTVVVKETELIPKAVETISPSVVRIYSSEMANSEFYGLGLVLTPSGTIVADDNSIGQNGDASIELSGSKRVRGFVTARNSALGLVYITVATSTEGGAIAWTPVHLAQAAPQLGATAVLITGKSAAKIAQGIVSAFAPMTEKENAGINVLETDLPKDVIIDGSPIIDTSGTVLGISTRASRKVDDAGFLSASALTLQTKEIAAQAQ